MTEFPVDPSILDNTIDSDSYYEFWENDYMDRSDEIDILRKLTKKLSERDQALYQDYYIEGMTQCECAEKYDIAQCTIHARLQRIQQRLQVLNELPDVNWDWVFQRLATKKQQKFIDVISNYIRTCNQLETAAIITEKYGKQFGQGQVSLMIKTAVKLCSELNCNDASEYLSIMQSKGAILNNRSDS